MKQISGSALSLNSGKAERTQRVIAFFQTELEGLGRDGAYEEFLRHHTAARSEVRRSMPRIVPGKSKGPIYRRAREQMARIYDEAGSQTDVSLASRNWEIEARLTGAVAEVLEDQDRLVVDGGCGTGLDINALAQLFPEKQFIGYDVSEKQIEVARERTTRAGNDGNVRLFVAHHRALPEVIQPNSVDAFLMKFDNWEEGLIPEAKERAASSPEMVSELHKSRYKEILRALRNDGTLIRTAIAKSLPNGIPEISGFKHTGMSLYTESPTKIYVVNSYQKAS